MKTVFDFLENKTIQKHIILERTNYLRVIVSGQVLKATGESHIKLGEKPKTPKEGLQLDANNIIVKNK